MFDYEETFKDIEKERQKLNKEFTDFSTDLARSARDFNPFALVGESIGITIRMCHFQSLINLREELRNCQDQNVTDETLNVRISLLNDQIHNQIVGKGKRVKKETIEAHRLEALDTYSKHFVYYKIKQSDKKDEKSGIGC